MKKRTYIQPKMELSAMQNGPLMWNPSPTINPAPLRVVPAHRTEVF